MKLESINGLADRVVESIATCHPKLTRGQVWCKSCGATLRVDAAKCIRYGWPKCCGHTMTIDSPQEREVDHD